MFSHSSRWAVIWTPISKNNIYTLKKNEATLEASLTGRQGR